MFESVTESDKTLATWSLPPRPLPLGEFQCPAKRLPDHRKHYLDYEGDVSDGRGTVRRIDAGTFERLDDQRFRLRGAVFVGTLEFLPNVCRFLPTDVKSVLCQETGDKAQSHDNSNICYP